MTATYEPLMGFARKLPNAAEAVNKKAKMPHWVANPTNFTLLAPEQLFFYRFDFQTVYCQTLGLDPWITRIPDHTEAVLTAFQKLDVNKLKTLSLKITTQIPLQMIHAELTELVADSYLLNPSGLESTYGKIEDLSLTIYGRRKETKCVTMILPQTIEQAKAAFLGIGNLDVFMDPKFVNTSVHEHMRRISTDCLTFVIDVSRDDAQLNSLHSFLDGAFEWMEEIVEETVLKIKGINSNRISHHGNGSATS